MLLILMKKFLISTIDEYDLTSIKGITPFKAKKNEKWQIRKHIQELITIFFKIVILLNY
jgi:hypothetical protein